MTTSIPKTLIDNYKAGLVIPWVGAGLSIPAGLPSWYQLVQLFIDEVAAAGVPLRDQEELQALANSGRQNSLEDVVDFCRDHLGVGEYGRFLKRVLGTGFASTNSHSKLFELRWPALITSNYDLLIEKAYVSKTNQLPVVFTSLDNQALWQQQALGEHYILKVHGDLNKPDSIVLTSNDYTRHVFGNYLFMEFLRRQFATRTLLFLGTSLSDTYVNMMLEEICYVTSGVGLPHYALMFDCGPVRARMLRKRLNVTPIVIEPVPSHEDAVIDFLERLRTA